MRELLVWLNTDDNGLQTLGIAFIAIWLVGYLVRTVREAWKGE